MNDTWLYLTFALVGIVLLPAIVAGGGFILAVLLAVAVLLAFLGGPKLWDLYKTQNIGARGREGNWRDLVNPDGDLEDIEEGR
jgi:hypothetical protein